MGLSLMNILGLSSNIYIVIIACYWKFFLLQFTQVLCQYRLCRADHSYLKYLVVQRQLSHVNGRKLELLYDWRFRHISSYWRIAPWDSRPAIIFQLNTCFHSPYITSSLTRGWVWNLQLLLVLASAVILRSDSRGTCDHMLLSQIRNYPNLGARFPYLYFSGSGWSCYSARHWVSFRRLIQPARVQWRYSTPPPNGLVIVLLSLCLYTTSAQIS
jgi:hypothetical protein